MRPALAIIELRMCESFAAAAEFVGAPSTNLQNLVSARMEEMKFDQVLVTINLDLHVFRG